MLRWVSVLAAVVLLATVALAAFTPGQLQLVTVPTGDGDRFYVAYLPLSLANTTAALPVALVFHELGSTCLDLMEEPSAALQQTAQEKQVVVIAPCGLKGSLGYGWNAGTCCGFNASGPNDVAFSLQVMDSVSNNVYVNTSAVGVFGMGNGAFMAQTLVCNAPDRFPFSGTISGLVVISPGNLQGMATCTSLVEPFATRPRCVLIHGDQDGTVGWSGEPLLGLPTVVENFMQWGVRNQCNALVENWNQGPFESRKYTNCLYSADVELVRWWGGGHTWPTQAANGFAATAYLFDRLLRLN